LVFEDAIDGGTEDAGQFVGLEWGVVVACGQQVRAADERDGEGVDVGGEGDSAEAALCREIGRDRLGDLGRERHAAGGGQAQPGEELMTGTDEADDPHGRGGGASHAQPLVNSHN
jgi:hypothetical protein